MPIDYWNILIVNFVWGQEVVPDGWLPAADRLKLRHFWNADICQLITNGTTARTLYFHAVLTPVVQGSLLTFLCWPWSSTWTGTSLADPGGAAGMRPPNRIQFFCFHTCFCWKAYVSEVGTPQWVSAPPMGNPGSATAHTCKTCLACLSSITMW